MFFAVFLLFAVLILRLGYLQIVKGEAYAAESKATSETKYTWNVPRGKMYDRNGNVILENEPIYTLTYSDPEDDTSDSLTTAKKLSKLITVDTEDVKDRDKKDYWILAYPDEALAKVSDDERAELDDKEEYQLLLERITDEELASLTEEEIQIYTIKAKMDADSPSANRIKENLDTEEIAVINEHLDQLPGIDVKLDSQRKYPYGDTFKQMFGKIGQIPEESADEYKKAGYDMDELVGKSFLELKYESVLRGIKEEQTYVKNRSGTIVRSEITTEGQTGKDLILTIDMDLQQKVDTIVEEELRKEAGANSAYVVMLNPTNGEILAISGKTKDSSGKITNETYGTIYNAYAMGSTVKGATIATAFSEGLIEPGTTYLDAPIKLAGTPTKKSWKNLGLVNDISALEQSSNVYMFHIAMKLGGYNYSTRSGFKDPEGSYAKFREHYAQFGLGVETGIDLPYEATGYNGGTQKLGNLMDFAIGQFDTYTTMQLAQYVATIANDGVRMQPHLMKEIRDPDHEIDEQGELIEEFEPVEMNKVDLEEEYMDRIQEGFRRVFQGSNGTAASYFRGVDYNPAGKTGTAQVYNSAKKGYDHNLTLVGYAPFDQPEIAFAVVAPSVRSSSSSINKHIGRRILDAYFEDDATESADDATTAEDASESADEA